ncbi:Uncharacterized protein CK203_071330 [Vitis vinifera]|uniref:Uncharacterized protein n=1 Tax=Vitis vinifera TaxID=29760 RepID=A0A438ETB5_VITVI|nr:Uncharacterized protein CK203_071330 [Vitis vinifera]
MEGMVKKYQQKFRKVRDETKRWDELQSRLLSQFRNASSIIERLQAIQNSKKLRYFEMHRWDRRCSVKKADGVFGNHFALIEKDSIVRDGRQLVKGGSVKLTMKQLQQRIGVKPSLADCLDGLSLLHEMHQSEYLLKSSVVSALSTLTLKPSASDLGALHQLLVDQPNIPKEEVQFIFDIVFAEEIC